MSRYGAHQGTGATASSTANTKGSWAQLIASSGFAATHLAVAVREPTNTANYLADVGFGAGGAEAVLVPNLLAETSEGTTAPTGAHLAQLPLSLPSGTRIAARVQADVGSRSVVVQAIIGSVLRPMRRYGRATDYGTVTGTSRGTSVDPGGTVDTKGAYAQLTASCQTIRALLLMAGNQANANDTVTYWLADIAAGAGGAEYIVLPDVRWNKRSGANSMMPWWHGPFSVEVPSGTRLAARAQSGTNDATDRLADLAVIGIG